MQRNFYLGSNAAIVAGSANFAAILTAEAASLGLLPAQATAFGVVNSALQAAWSASSTPDTRTPVAVEATRDAIKAMRAAAIPLAKQLAGNPAVSDAQLIALGLLPRTQPTPRPATMTPPVVEALDVKGRRVKARVRQAGVVESRAKPIGSAGALIFSFVGPDAPSDPAAYKFEGLASRGTFEILFPNEVPSGATAWISAAWVSTRGQRGFGSTPISVTIQGGLIVAGEVA